MEFDSKSKRLGLRTPMLSPNLGLEILLNLATGWASNLDVRGISYEEGATARLLLWEVAVAAEMEKEDVSVALRAAFASFARV